MNNGVSLVSLPNRKQMDDNAMAVASSDILCNTDVDTNATTMTSQGGDQNFSSTHQRNVTTSSMALNGDNTVTAVSNLIALLGSLI
jgi:hypothetical protein